jgi:hypothetical protein
MNEYPKKNIGIITYHAAYNFGSVLQAYATQEAVRKLGFNPEIINYRLSTQKDYYEPLYRTRFGWKKLVLDIEMFPVASQRKMRRINYEKFISEYMNLSEELTEPEDVKNIYDRYKTIVSGSDQIWNLHSFELDGQNSNYISPYLLESYRGKAISYASSVANMSDEELDWLISRIKHFSAVSIREQSSINRIKNIYNSNVVHVCDPTFLLTKEEWIERLNLSNTQNEDYILYYSLGESFFQLRNFEPLKKISRFHGCPIHVVTPFAYLPSGGGLINCSFFGPKEFLVDLYNSKAVITDSFHGTALSIVFRKNLRSLIKNQGSEFRKSDLLTCIGIADSDRTSIDCLYSDKLITEYSDVVENKISDYISNSYKYLETNI